MFAIIYFINITNYLYINKNTISIWFNKKNLIIKWVLTNIKKIIILYINC